MSWKRIVITIVVVASSGLALVVAFLHKGRVGPVAAKPEETAAPAAVPLAKADDTSGIRAALANISARLSKLEEPRLTPTDQEAAAPAARSAAEPEEAEPTPEMIKTQRKQAIERLKEVDQRVELESRDNAWASAEEARINGLFREGSYGKTTLLSASCKSSICRVEVAHENQESSYAFESFRRSMAGDFHMQHIDPEDDGTRRTIAYFVRPGHQQESPLFDMMYTQAQ